MKTLLILVSMLIVLAVLGMLVFVFVIQNVEQPEYALISASGDFELRDYPRLVVAEVKRKGSREEGLRAGFGPLARYIFAKERGGVRIAMTAPVQQKALGRDERIAMTAPVTQSATGDGDAWMVQFIMPSTLSLGGLPEPGNKDVQLRELPARRVAAVRFSGRTNDRLIAEQEARLREWMKERNLTPAGTAVYAYYNDPLTPGFLRRNEVMIPVVPTPEAPRSSAPHGVWTRSVYIA